MTQTVYGVALDPIGAAMDGGRYWSTPSALLRSVQNDTIPVDRDHSGHPVGQVIYIERARGRVWIVAEVDDTIAPERLVRFYPPPPTSPLEKRAGPELRTVPVPFYWSVSRIGGPDHGFVLNSVALVQQTARVAPDPVVFRDGDACMAAFRSKNEFERDLLNRAHEYDLRRHGAALVVVDQDASGSERNPAAWNSPELTQPGQLEFRSAELADVSPRARLVEIIAAPYDTPATVPHKGRRVVESFTRTAWLGVNKQPNRDRIRVWVDHRPEHVVGRVVDLDPHNQAGLVAQFKVSRTVRGDETLALAEDGALDASVGFNVLQDQWEGSSRRRVTRAWLHHLGLTSDPAYDGAHVLSVRAGVT
jgi:HK97 family phage prohead protease